LGRTILHIILAVLLWSVFGYYWYIVVQRPLSDHTRIALTAVGSIIAVMTLFSTWWVYHNLRIARRSERRVRRREVAVAPERDFLGRTFVATSEYELKQASYVEVHLVQMDDAEMPDHKIFRVTESIPETG
jgi:hypothetical protein